MYITIPILSVGPYSLAVVAGLLLYWNTSIVLSRSLTAFMATLIAMKLDLAFHLLYASLHHIVAIAFRLRAVWDAQDLLNHFQAHSQLYVIADISSLALLVGNTLLYWSAALVTRIALSALATRAELWMRRWESQSAVGHVLIALGSATCISGCALQWAYYTLLPRTEVEEGGFASLLMWYTSIVYIVAIGVRAAGTLATSLMRFCGYRLVQCLANKLDRGTARALEDSVLNPHSEVHPLYMAYFYAVVCAVTAWYYAPPSLPLWIQGFVLLRLCLIARASGELQRYKQVLDRFPSVSADPSKACAICRDDFVSGEQVTCLPCGHTFHGACVRSWLMRATNCPTCRHPVSDAALRSAPPRHSVVRSTVAGTLFSGSVQPLAPRLPAAAAPRTQSTRRRTGDSTRPAFSSHRAGSVRRIAINPVTELERIEAERRALAEWRAQLASLSSSLVAGRLAEGEVRRGTAVSSTPTRVSSTEEEGTVDPLLFTDTPLTSEALSSGNSGVSAAAAPPRRKRQRAPAAASTAGDADTVDDETLSRQRRE